MIVGLLLFMIGLTPFTGLAFGVVIVHIRNFLPFYRIFHQFSTHFGANLLLSAAQPSTLGLDSGATGRSTRYHLARRQKTLVEVSFL